jgi:hypothetical protein
MSQIISSETWRIVVAHHMSLMLGKSVENWDLGFDAYKIPGVPSPTGVAQKGVVIDGSLRKGESRDQTI